MSLRLARRVANEIRSKVVNNIDWGDAEETVYVGADGEPTYRIDDIAEKAAIRAMEGEPILLLSEEAGLVQLCEETPEWICVLDPVDGSTNAVTGLPFYCTSIAFARWNANPILSDIESGVVMNLVTGDLFEGDLGGGAKLNGQRITGSSKTSLKGLIASLYLKKDYDLISGFSKVRAFGAVALELAHTAQGGIDCLYDNRERLKVTDIAAGKLIVEETGGRVTDSKGNDLNHSISRLEKVSVLACGNPKLHSLILKEVMKE
jgi:myo-inositol-1(or 4)-monophosphatase